LAVGLVLRGHACHGVLLLSRQRLTVPGWSSKPVFDLVVYKL
jgi:hypothetical protein